MYFLYSREQFDEKNQILAKSGKQFVAGYVVVNGIKKDFTLLSSKPDINRYIDVRIVAEGDPKDFTYEKPKTVRK
jgi:hypothetical protein